MKRLLALYRSTLGKKAIVAVTGIVMIGFLIGHVAGNLKIFLPPLEDGTPDIDHYAESLRTIGVPFVPYEAVLWVARFVLLGSLVLHVLCVIQLSSTNATAREISYSKRKFATATSPARWMMFTGLYLLFFIIVHILHFTLGVIEPSQFEHGRVFGNLQAAFTRAPWALFYVVSMAVVALHLYHGAWSLFQSMGWDNPDRNRGIRRFAAGLAVVLFIGFIAVPTAYLTGIVKLNQDESAASHMHDRNSTGATTGLSSSAEQGKHNEEN
ncbi:MAG: succinate dehydrogenase cytochrome b subunit [Pirellulaceae bacterium]